MPLSERVGLPTPLFEGVVGWDMSGKKFSALRITFLLGLEAPGQIDSVRSKRVKNQRIHMLAGLIRCLTQEQTCLSFIGSAF